MNCSSCDKPMYVILLDRAFCESCYEELLKRQRQVIVDMVVNKFESKGEK